MNRRIEQEKAKDKEYDVKIAALKEQIKEAGPASFCIPRPNLPVTPGVS